MIKKTLIIYILLNTLIYASFMDSVANIVESTLSDEEVKTKKVSTVTTDVETLKNSSSTLLDDVVDGVKDTIGFKEKKKKKSSLMGDAFTAMKEVTGIEKVKSDNTFFNGGILGEMASIIELEKGETLGLPSVFGFNKKKDTKVFGSTVLGDTLLGDAKEVSTGFYRGFKNTGESTEFMSGVMYKSSKIYNEMFDIFDDSPLNIFDDKDEREPSVFDVLDKGNSMLDFFD